MDIKEVMKRSDKINGNPLPNTFILHAMVGENKSFEEQIERIAIQIYQSQELHFNEISEALFSNVFIGIPGMMAINPENGIKILKQVFKHMNIVCHPQYVSWSFQNNESIVSTARTILTITLAWFSRVKAGTQSGLDDYITEVMTNNHNLTYADHCFLEIANDKINEMLWN